jgi:hypothetical protein
MLRSAGAKREHQSSSGESAHRDSTQKPNPSDQATILAGASHPRRDHMLADQSLRAPHRAGHTFALPGHQ